MEAGTEEFKVFYKRGKADHRYDESYEEIFSGIITGNGRGVVTPLPAFSTPVKIYPRSPVTFYISVTNHDGANVWYDRGSGTGTIYASDDYLTIAEGYASGYPWNGYALDRQWNGKSKWLRYSEINSYLHSRANSSSHHVTCNLNLNRNYSLQSIFASRKHKKPNTSTHEDDRYTQSNQSTNSPSK